jgi:hypothetical protein
MNLPSKSLEAEQPNVWERLKEDCHLELEEARKEHKEIDLLIAAKKRFDFCSPVTDPGTI